MTWREYSRIASRPARRTGVPGGPWKENSITASGANRSAKPSVARAIPADDADLRAAIISAITLGITVSRHLVKSDELATADPAQVISLLRPCVLSLAARPEHSGP
jgi:hypothetical protein